MKIHVSERYPIPQGLPITLGSLADGLIHER